MRNVCVEEEKSLSKTVAVFLMAEIKPEFSGNLAVGFSGADLSLTHC